MQWKEINTLSCKYRKSSWSFRALQYTWFQFNFATGSFTNYQVGNLKTIQLFFFIQSFSYRSMMKIIEWEDKVGFKDFSFLIFALKRGKLFLGKGKEVWKFSQPLWLRRSLGSFWEENCSNYVEKGWKGSFKFQSIDSLKKKNFLNFPWWEIFFCY